MTFTFRPFLKQDGLSVMILERFVNEAYHDGPHLSSEAHNNFSRWVTSWNSSARGAIVGKVHGYYHELEQGVFSRDLGPQELVSGFADTVLYQFNNSTDAQQYLNFLEPLSRYVRMNETNITFTFRPFLSTENLSVLLLSASQIKRRMMVRILQARP